MIFEVCIILTAVALATSLAPTTREPTCVDHDLYCGVLFNTQFCKTQLAQSQCPKTCQTCSQVAPTTATSFETSAATTTSLPTSPTSQEMTTTTSLTDECIDKDSTCPGFKNTSYCETNPLVSKMCPLTCGVCTNDCVDLDPDCSVLLESHFCNEDLAKKLCAFTCHVCAPTATTVTNETPTATYTSSTGPPCVDLDPKCADLHNKTHECDEFSLVRKLCPETCDLCLQGHSTTTISQPASPSTTVTSPPYLGPLSCRTCEDPFCEMGVEADHTCPEHAPFCMNIVGQDRHNIPTLAKRCADKSQCDERWLNGSALKTECLNLNLNSPPEMSFECTYCCITQECNVPAIPRSETLYRGLSNT
ncbi:location of vulva defective 1-like isoform X1 [Gigantopelta aegis]|uniref:location of vulva defective 1-like isoform X1 n=1 Tax=Gigantopelta aegis TaxID=1735272 RepID=UPI001B88DB0F|nr:location of vulva defective 1-like isoform X1 [Gigantopelta aegis]XP_041368080.1 location of vulva defective 1-like isoform X1 [Gigantopelta aegis]XP_041368081.1 location of vulva defective 1-like isoform X1 [Gigantopelta aegis]